MIKNGFGVGMKSEPIDSTPVTQMRVRLRR
jgi:hypothetical protein